MKNIIILLLIFFFNTQINAQRNQAIYAELGGAGLIYTINYDTRYSEAEDKLGVRIGIGVISDAIIIPLQLNYLFGTGNNKFEVGAGFTTLFIDFQTNNDAEVLASATLMYRYQEEDGHLFFRLGLSPSIAFSDYKDGYYDIQKLFWIWPGISVGYKF